MLKVHLIHWHQQEAEERAARLEKAGYAVRVTSDSGKNILPELRQSRPDAVVIDLSRLPSHGRTAGVVLRKQKSTRDLPLLFVDGQLDKIAQVKSALPDAVFANWDNIGTALPEAIQRAPAQPVVPTAEMTGCASKPLAKKLGIRPGSQVTLMTAPENFVCMLGTLPEGAQLSTKWTIQTTLGIWFVRSIRELGHGIRTMTRRAVQAPIWIAWPKKTSEQLSDLSEAIVRATALEKGLVDYKVCALDPTWAGLLFRPRRRQA